jgi:hypothetical protein
MTDRAPNELVTELRLRGYAVLPAPRHVELSDATARVDSDWSLAMDGVDARDIAVATLRSALQVEHGLALRDGTSPRCIRLAIKPGTVATGTNDSRQDQAYRLTIMPSSVEVVGNAAVGLFYGVQTLIQLLDGSEKRVLPVGTITDWPHYELRFVHWDVKHHLDRIETLKRFIDWNARFKCNMISMEMEDKFEYPSHPDVGAPSAFTTAQLQDLTRYAPERHIQLVPNLQAPAHVGFILKHPKYAHLKCDGSNYMITMEEPEALKLLFDLYDDLVAATPGVKYFHVSTDEVYYAGIDERKYKPYNPVNRSQTFVDYVLAAHKHLSKHGRRIIIWGEHPLLAEHVKQLPADIIDGIVGSKEMLDEELKLGMRHLAYAPMQGMEMLFPNYFASTDSHGGGNSSAGRLADGFIATSRGRAAGGNPIGTFVAGWDDSGVHNETFWLGWATMAQYGWIPGRPTIEQTAADFFDIYYGRQVHNISEIYSLMQTGARAFQSTWEEFPSRVRGPAYGNHKEKRPIVQNDMTLLPPALPRWPDLSIEPIYSTRYARQLADAPKQLAQNDRLLALLFENLPRATRNRHNLEVFISLAYLMRQTIQLVMTLGQIEQTLAKARDANAAGTFPRALDLLLQAHTDAGRVIGEKKTVLAQLTAVWEKGRYPRNIRINGRDYLHVFDDVKDHIADRRVDLSYMTMMQDQIGLDDWRTSLAKIIRNYGRLRTLPIDLAETAEAPILG